MFMEGLIETRGTAPRWYLSPAREKCEEDSYKDSEDAKSRCKV